MTKSNFMDKYPVHTLEIPKNETTFTSVDAIIEDYKSKIEAHKIATYISVFDHYSHTQSICGEINSDILDAKNIIFCFGAALPNTKMLAIRPRSIGVAEMKDSFMIEFMEAPKEQLQELMVTWTKSLLNK